MIQQEQKTVILSVKKLLRWITALVVIVIALIVLNAFGRGPLVGVRNSVLNEDSVSYMIIPDESEYPQVFNQNNGSITDTREFMKINYSGAIKTRNVKDVSRDVRGIIRDMGGRIDKEKVTEKYGSLGFVIPKSNLDDFRDEIESLTHKKLYVETTSSQNLLNQKQNIEQSADLIAGTLAQLEKTKKDADSRHTTQLAAFQKELTLIPIQLTAIRQRIADSNDNQEKEQLRIQESQLLNQEMRAKQNRDEVTRIYNMTNNELQAQIVMQKNNLQNNVKQDIQFENNIETVTGSIEIRWVSIWQLAKIFSPVHPIVIGIIIIVILWYILKKLRIVPLIVIKW